MSRNAVVDTPGALFSATEIADVTVEIDQGIVYDEGLFDIIGSNTGRIHYLHADCVLAGGCEDAFIIVSGLPDGVFAFGIGKQPDGDYALVGNGEGDLVKFLIHAYYGLIDGSGGGSRSLGGMIDFFP